MPKAWRFALVCATDWIMGVGGSVADEARAHRPQVVTVELNGWEGKIAADQPPQVESARLIEEVSRHIAATRKVQPPNSRTVAIGVGGAVLPFVGLFQADGILRSLMILLGVV